MIRVAGGIPVPVPLREANDFSFDMGAFERLAGERTRLVILNSPNNPTGGVMAAGELENIARVVRELDCWVLSDEIYSRLVYSGPSYTSIVTIPGMAERTILVDGFSKAYAMTGWRLGYGIMPVDLAQKVELLLTHSIGCSAHFTQVAGLEALRGPQDRTEEMVARLETRRDLIVAGLNSLPGVNCRVPKGAFYAFPNVKGLGVPSASLAQRLLEEAGVSLITRVSIRERRGGVFALVVCYL